MKKTIITIVIILASLGLIGFILTKNKTENEAKTAIVAEKNASVSVKVDTVKTEEVSLDFVSNGNFEPIQELKFSAEKSVFRVRITFSRFGSGRNRSGIESKFLRPIITI